MVHSAGDDDRRGVELAETFAEIARTLIAEPLDATLDKISQAAVEIVDGCDHAGISLIRGRSITTEGASDGVPHRVDAIQYEVDAGPCLEAMREHELIHVDDLAGEERWPEFSKRTAEETGIRSMASFRLFSLSDTLGALNFYSRQPKAFDEDSDRVGAVLAAHAAVALISARQLRQHEEAIRSRDVIGQAKGILMAREGISEDEAFEVLRRASQRMNVKLREVADAVAHGRPLSEDG